MPFVGAYAALSGLGFTGRVEARYNVIDMQLTNAPLAVYGQNQRAAGMSYAAKGSYRIPAGALYVEPSAGLSLSRLAIDDQATNVGDLSFGLARLTLGHAGLKIGGDFSQGALAWQPFAMASVWREWLSGATISVPQGPTITSTGLGNFAEVGFGASATLAHTGLSGFGQGAWAFGPKISGLAATGGLKFDF
jgi:outer membrane autotransporter protein